MAKETGRKLIAQNKKARHDYHIEDTWEAGLVLMGTEVKSLRQGRASLVDGFAEIDNGEAWLLGVHIPEYSQGTWTNHSARRRRKLLLNRSEIDKIERKITDKGYTIIPLALFQTHILAGAVECSHERWMLAIDVAADCTHCDRPRFYSYRRDKDRTGQQMGVVVRAG